MFKFVILISGLLFLATNLSGQENFSSNVSTSVSDDEKLLITFDINDNAGKSFNVILMVTYQGSAVKTSSVIGDVGSNIKPGSEKAIVWYFKNDFKGEIGKVNVDVFAYKENEPQAIFKIQSVSNNGYAPCELKFLNTSSYANEYQWDFGDPMSGAANFSFQKDPVHIFQKGGIYSIALIARSTQLQLENTYYQSIEVKTHDATIADFQIVGDDFSPGAKFKFVNKSVNADVFSWNFGDPASKKKNESDKKDEEHKFEKAGTFKVSLIVKNNFSKIADTITKDVVIAQQQLPVAKFVFSTASDIAPSLVAFKNMSEFSTSYKWNFGDPASGEKNASTEVNPAHTFEKPGNYLVELQAFSSNDKKPVKYIDTIKIKDVPKPPEALFTIENNNVLGPATVIFKNSSKNSTSYSWDFGDTESGAKNASNAVNPTHTYLKPGIYKVVLKSTNRVFNTESVFADNVIITRASKPPVAGFAISNNNGFAPAEVTFVNKSENADSFVWDFGDTESANNSSAEAMPKHVYTKAGRFKVVFTAINKTTGEKSTFSDFVIVNEPVVIVKAEAKFEVGNNNIPEPATITFKNVSVNAESYFWDFGDPKSADNTSTEKNPVHTYASAGRYQVLLSAKNKSSDEPAKFTDYVIITRAPKPEIRPVTKFSISNTAVTEQSQKAPRQITFKTTSTDVDLYEWNFNDPESGTANFSSEPNPTHTFTKPGRFKVELKVTNKKSGLTNTYSDFVNITEAVADPKAKFDINNNNTVEPATVFFTNNSENATSYAWDFGDPASGSQNTSTVLNPTHEFKIEGTYKVVLAVLNSNTGKEDISEKTVTVLPTSNPPKADFEYQHIGEFAPVNIEFKNLSVNFDSCRWNFGDFDSESNLSGLKNPVHFYSVPGNYRVTLEVVNQKNGRVDKISKEISLKSDFVTFTKSDQLGKTYSNLLRIIPVQNDEFLLIGKRIKKGSGIIKIDRFGNVLKENVMDIEVFDISGKETDETYYFLATENSKNLFIQSIDNDLKIKGDKKIFAEVEKLKTDFAFPLFKKSISGDFGIISNVISTKYDFDLMYQKADKDGNFVPMPNRTFKYIGTKLVTAVNITQDAGFCFTGYWQEDKKSVQKLLFAKVDRNGVGEIHLINSVRNITGCDISESFQNGFALLRAEENEVNSNFFDLSFAIIDESGGPTDCSNDLPCPIKRDDVLLYKPSMIKTVDGYIIAGHAFNGADYNIKLFWLDKTGKEITLIEEIKLPNDQFVMNLIQTDDGGLQIVGAERQNKISKALIIKTDKFGKIYKN